MTLRSIANSTSVAFIIMVASEAFTIIEDDGSHPPRLFDDYQKGTSGKMTDLDVQLVTTLREKHPDLL